MYKDVDMTAVEKELRDYVAILNEEQKKAVLGIIKAFASHTEEYSHWEDGNFVAEMEKRYNEYKEGKVKTVSLNELEKKARQELKKIKAK